MRSRTATNEHDGAREQSTLNPCVAHRIMKLWPQASQSSIYHVLMSQKKRKCLCSLEKPASGCPRPESLHSTLLLLVPWFM